MNYDEMMDLLKRECRYYGGPKQWARAVCLSGDHVECVLKGEQEPSKLILRQLGLQRIVTYERT